jgi:hypothetical protein
MKLIHSPEPQHQIEAGGQQARDQYQGKQIDIKPGHHKGQKQKHDKNRYDDNQGLSVYKSVQQNLYSFLCWHFQALHIVNTEEQYKPDSILGQ